MATTSCTSGCSKGRRCLTTAVKQWFAVGSVPVPLRTRGWHGVGFFKYPQGCTMPFASHSTSQAGTRWVELCMVHALRHTGCGTLLQMEVAPPRFSRVVGLVSWWLLMLGTLALALVGAFVAGGDAWHSGLLSSHPMLAVSPSGERLRSSLERGVRVGLGVCMLHTTLLHRQAWFLRFWRSFDVAVGCSLVSCWAFCGMLLAPRSWLKASVSLEFGLLLG